jgi:hypothetical protein
MSCLQCLSLHLDSILFLDVHCFHKKVDVEVFQLKEFTRWIFKSEHDVFQVFPICGSENIIWLQEKQAHPLAL